MYIDKTVYMGRPAQKRSPREEAAYTALDSLGIEYFRMDHDSVNTMDACKEIDLLLGISACKNLFLTNKRKTRFFLVVIDGDKKFDSKALSAQLGLPRLSFGNPALMEELLGVSPGSVSILSVANDKENKVELLVDRDVLNRRVFGCHPCLNTSSLKIKTDDIFNKFLPAYGHTPTFFNC